MKTWKYIFLALAIALAPCLVQAAGLRTVVQEQFLVTYRSPEVTNSTGVVLIDLSDTSAYPHTKTDQINITATRVYFENADGSTASVKMGVLTGVNASTGDVTNFWTHRTSASSAVSTLDAYDAQYRTKVSNGSALHILSNNTDTVSTLFQNDVESPDPTEDFVTPAAGDIVAIIESDSRTAVRVNFEILYNSDR